MFACHAWGRDGATLRRLATALVRRCHSSPAGVPYHFWAIYYAAKKIKVFIYLIISQYFFLVTYKKANATLNFCTFISFLMLLKAF
jgi:hypothetical protein